MSGPENFESQDDEEPPSKRLRLGWGDPLFGKIDLDYIEMIKRLWSLEAETAEHAAILLLTSNAEAIFARYNVLTGDNEVCVTNGDARLRRYATLETDIGVNGEYTEPKQVFIYFYSELQPDDEPYCRSWINTSNRVDKCYQNGHIEPASSVNERMMEHFPETTHHKRRGPLRLGTGLLRRLVGVSTSL